MHMNVYDAFLQAGGCAVDTPHQQHQLRAPWVATNNGVLPFRNYHDDPWCHMPDFSNLPGDRSRVLATRWFAADAAEKEALTAVTAPSAQGVSGEDGFHVQWIPRPYLLSLYCRVLFMFFVYLTIFDAHGAFQSLTRTSLECVNTIQHV